MFAFWNILCEGSQIDESCVTRMLSLIQQITRLDNVTSVFSDFQITFCLSFLNRPEFFFKLLQTGRLFHECSRIATQIYSNVTLDLK